MLFALQHQQGLNLMRFVEMELPNTDLDMQHVVEEGEWLDELPLNLVDKGMLHLQLKRVEDMLHTGNEILDKMEWLMVGKDKMGYPVLRELEEELDIHQDNRAGKVLSHRTKQLLNKNNQLGLQEQER